jgi:hypothetical protein
MWIEVLVGRHAQTGPQLVSDQLMMRAASFILHLPSALPMAPFKAACAGPPHVTALALKCFFLLPRSSCCL